MIETKLRKGTFQHMESELFAYHDTRREVIRLRNEILYGSGPIDENVGGGRSNLPGDPTGQKGTRVASDKRLRNLEAIVDAIEGVVERLPEQKQQLIKLRYWTRPQTLTWDGVALKLDISRRTAINWRNEIVYAVAEKIGWR